MPYLFQQRLNSELYARYRIDSQAEIIALLRSLQEERSQVVLHFSDHAYVVSRVLEVWPQQGRIALDFGPDETVNEALLAAGSAVAETNLHQVSIQFELGDFRRVMLHDGPALEAALPACMLRLQRRETFRVPTPVLEPITLFVPEQERCPLNLHLRVVDISAGGAGTVCDATQFQPEAGMVFRDCQMLLPEVGLLVADMEVRHVMPLHEGNTDQLQCGMRFLALPPPMASFVQRFVMQLEREWRKLR
ncbi:MAG TPA: flagellar brake protein [Burkholderiales bacterium]|nr:flagellar brake protein [Burkholderiales bacterium]